jgi:molybdenum cofactor cytidylyltransferase
MKRGAIGLPEAFGLRSGELVSITGGGGKSSLMFALARALPGRVIMTTTTRIFAAQTKLAEAICVIPSETPSVALEGRGRPFGELPGESEQSAQLGGLLERHGRCLVIGEIAGEKASGVPPDLPGRLLARADVDYVLVEADGSRMRPCKAPAGHEPVVPPETTVLVPVAGIDAVGGRLADVAHRPERVAALTGLTLSDEMTSAALAALLSHPEGGLKGAPDRARLIPLLNKVMTAKQSIAADEVARLLLRNERIDSVVIGAVRESAPVLAIQRRVTAVVLAAGESKRMGQLKQLLPWGQTTVLAQSLSNLRASAVHDILVVSGHQAGAVEAVAREHGLDSVHNPDYASGEMLSSLQTAVRKLPENRSAVLVMLADQPMVGPEIVDLILDAYRKGQGELLAPSFRGRRGNPVLIGRRYFAELLALPAGAAPRDLLKSHPEDVVTVEVSTDSVLRDLDRPEDYERWRPR